MIVVSLFCFTVFTGSASATCPEESVLIDHHYIGACGYTETTSFSLNEPANITKIRIWYDTLAGGDSISAYLIGDNGYFNESGTIEKGGCQWSWCEAVWELNDRLEQGEYMLMADSESICLDPSGATTLVLFGCDADDDVPPISSGIDPPHTVTLIDQTSSPEEAPVYMGPMVVQNGLPTLSGEMELSIDFPAYNAPVDIWCVVFLPDGRSVVVDSNGALQSLEASGFLPLAQGISGVPISKQVLSPFDVNGTARPSIFSPWPEDGLWAVYWLITPTAGGDIMAAIENEAYDLGYYVFEVKTNDDVNEDEPDILISDYSPQNGPAGSPIFLKLERVTPELMENLTIYFTPAENGDSAETSENPGQANDESEEDGATDNGQTDGTSILLQGAQINADGTVVQLTLPADALSGEIQVKSGDAVSNKVLFSVTSMEITPILTKSLLPSMETQTIQVSDALSVTIPGGMIDQERSLSISRVENPPVSAVAPFADMNAYDITIEGLEQLSDVMEITMAYDPEALNPDDPPEDQLMPMRWDDTDHYWYPLPFSVDESEATLTIHTDHLCVISTLAITGLVIGNVATWSGVGQEVLNDVYVTPEGNFRLLYSKTAIENDVTLLDDTWSKITCPSPMVQLAAYSDKHPHFIQDMGNFLESTLKRYRDTYHLKDPVNHPGWIWGTTHNPITVKIDSWWSALGGNPNYEKIWEILHFPTDHLKDYSDFTTYGTMGHELFHRMQAEYYGLVGFKTPSNLWWMEATAEYAGYRAAWATKNDGLHGKTGSDFFSYPLSTTGKMANQKGWNLNQSYEYAASAFVQFLVEKRGLDFKDLVEHVAGGSPLYAPLSRINGYNGLSLLQIYREFAAWGIFGSDSFLKRFDISDMGDRSEVMTVPDNGEMEIIFSSRHTDSTIAIYKSEKAYEKTTNVPSPVQVIAGEEAFRTSVTDGESIYLLAVNPGEADDALDVHVKVYDSREEKSHTTHTFHLKGGYSAKVWAIQIKATPSGQWQRVSVQDAGYSPYVPNPNYYSTGDTFQITSSPSDTVMTWVHPEEEMVVNDRLTYTFDAKATSTDVETMIKWTDTIYPDSGKQYVDMTLTLTRQWSPDPFPGTLTPGTVMAITETVSGTLTPDPATLGDRPQYIPEVFGSMQTQIDGVRLAAEGENFSTYTHIDITGEKDSLSTQTMRFTVPDGVPGSQLVISFRASDSGSAGLGYSYGSYMDHFQSAGKVMIYEFR